MDNGIYGFLAPAKVNLFLYVTGKRPDGYHDIFTLFYPISIYDEIILEKAAARTLICNNPDTPLDNENIIIKTDNILKEEYGLKDNFKITLNKRIPMGAGLGGGSSDAAAYIKGVNEASKLNMSCSDMASVMARLGSDTVFFLNPVPSLASGRGTELKPAPALPELYFVIVNPNIHISTKKVYESGDLRLTNLSGINNIYERYDFKELKNIMANDMEPPVFNMCREVKDIADYLGSFSGGRALMSGSGSTVFCVFDNIEARDICFIKTKERFGNYFTEKAALADITAASV
ncbi:MAG: 4-(cytidine 5'-diphospho)-2-C-methyl-D-erythritol kinase [Mucispirillum sp.]|nr:4-(cytidine 5'-diphospho)-2-C-methyl-D-erythritol kinase [Mucispirillum sp.]